MIDDDFIRYVNSDLLGAEPQQLLEFKLEEIHEKVGLLLNEWSKINKGI